MQISSMYLIKKIIICFLGLGIKFWKRSHDLYIKSHRKTNGYLLVFLYLKNGGLILQKSVKARRSRLRQKGSRKRSLSRRLWVEP